MTALELKANIEKAVVENEYSYIYEPLKRAESIATCIAIIDNDEKCTKENTKNYVKELKRALHALYETDEEGDVLRQLELDVIEFFDGLPDTEAK